MKYYTKTGDHGTTSLASGKRVPKTDIRISACGDLDELNAHIGLLHTFTASNLDPQLISIQTCLFHIGTSISASTTGGATTDDVAMLEHKIDNLQAQTTPPGTFVLPGGCKAAAQAHVCRAVCRRAERSLLYVDKSHALNPLNTQYLNRLSDYFFALALYLNFIEGVAEKKLYIACK